MKQEIPTVMAYGSWVFTCCMWSQQALVDDWMVVSEIGEQWSPNRPPLTTAPIVRVMEIPRASAIGMAIGSPRAQTPHELPVAKDTTI